jgi:hypothetical protein
MARPKRQKTVTMVTPAGVKQQFGIQHAERLLDLGPALNGGWSIDPDSNYYYDEENGIRLKSDKGNSAEA